LPHLNEIVDLGEEGMCFQNSIQLRAGESMDLSLDFSETRARIQAPAEVVWSNPSGRTGVRFQKLQPVALRQLKQWLFVNTVVAYANQANFSTEEHVAKTPAAEFDSISDLLISELEPAQQLLTDHTSSLAAITAIRREVEVAGANTDTALQLLADRARTLTRATGAAIAFSADGESMVCRASSGPDAPPIGTLFHVNEGFSGECVRRGLLLRCDDSETDSRVDRESCRALGVRSIVAAPIHENGTVIGILEVFSPQARAFESDDDVLRRLAEIVAETLNPRVQNKE